VQWNFFEGMFVYHDQALYKVNINAYQDGFVYSAAQNDCCFYLVFSYAGFDSFPENYDNAIKYTWMGRGMVVENTTEEMHLEHL
jgi:hypothetical protein